MPEQYEVTDSSDWLPTPLAPLAQLESSLRCQVCKDFFTTPMITSCSHTFCSLCIRRYLSQEGKCPACRESDQEIKLRRNWVVEELVTNFSKERRGLLQLAHTLRDRSREAEADSERPRKRRKVPENHVAVNGTERRSTRSQSKAVASASQQSVRSENEVIHDSEEEGSLYEEPQRQPPVSASREPNDGKVACPCCGRRMKETSINSHLDKCIAGDSHTPIEETDSPLPQPVPQQSAPISTIAYSKPKAVQQARLPFINYSLLNDNALRKKLRDLGIANHGSKDLMRQRHTEWVNLWNANCDSANPLPKRQLLQDLKVWEDTRGRQIEKAPPSGFMSKEFDRERHVKTQKDNFDELIRQARAKRGGTKSSTTNGDDSNRSENMIQPPSKPEGEKFRAAASEEYDNLQDQPHITQQTTPVKGQNPQLNPASNILLHQDRIPHPGPQNFQEPEFTTSIVNSLNPNPGAPSITPNQPYKESIDLTSSPKPHSHDAQLSAVPPASSQIIHHQ